MENNGYMIKQYLKDNGEPDVMFIHSEEELFKFIDKHKNDKIVIFKLGICLIDWS